MKISSDTLYQQWRNLTVLYPHRCDPGWVDFDVSVIMDKELKLDIERKQRSQGRPVKPGYEAFIEDMYSLIRPHGEDIVPKVGAGFLSSKYQMLPGVKMDYIVVPKLSCASAIYRSPSRFHKTIVGANRFTLSALERAGEFRTPTLAGKQQWDEGADFEFRNFKYDEQEPLPTDRPLGFRGARSAELEWIALNMIANYRFDKESVQLLYIPLWPPIFNIHLPKISLANKKDTGRESLARRESMSNEARANLVDPVRKKYSKRIKVTANSLLNSGFGDSDLKILNTFDDSRPLPERDTDLITDRKVINSQEMELAEHAKLREAEDRKLDAAKRLTFSRRHPLVYRESDPADETRKNDPNTGWLFLNDLYHQLLDTWYVRVFDPIQGEVVTKTVDEWRVECSLDNVPIMQEDQITWCLSKGLSVDQILILSPKVNDTVPFEKLTEIVNGFIEEELSLR